MFGRTSLTAFVGFREERIRTRRSWNHLSRKMEIVVLDFETTGLSPERHRVIEIGAVILNARNEIIRTFQTICNPRLSKKLPKFIVKFTGITDDMLIGKPSTESAMELLYDFIGMRTVLCHNASFDSKFLKSEMKRISKVVMNQFLCTLLISRRLLTGLGSYKLSHLKKFINFQAAANHHDHRALDDVLVTAALWAHLISRLQQSIGEGDMIHILSVLQIISITPKAKVGLLLQQERKRSKNAPLVLNQKEKNHVKEEISTILNYFEPEKFVGYSAPMIAVGPTVHIYPEMVMSTREVLGISALSEGHIQDTLDIEITEASIKVRSATLSGIDSAVLFSDIGEDIIVDDCAIATDINLRAATAARIDTTLLPSNVRENILVDDCAVAPEDRKKTEFDATIQLIASSLRVVGEPKRTSNQMSKSVSVIQFTKRRRSLRLSNPF